LPLLALAGSPVLAQETGPEAPSTEMLGTFSTENWAHLCPDGAERNVRVAALIGELGRSYKFNFLALPPHPLLLGRPIPDTVEARAAAWLIAAVQLDAPHPGISDEEFQTLNKMARALVRYLEWAPTAPIDHRYRTVLSAADPSVRPALAMRVREANSDRFRARLLGLFEPVLGIRADNAVSLSCLPEPPQSGNVQAATPNPPLHPPPGGGRDAPRLAVRGQIDDLVALRGTDEFKKASAATISYVDNNEAGTTNFAINGVVGLGTNFGPNNALYAFVQYTRNDNETDAVGDDDDAKDVHSISPGLFVRRPVAFAQTIYGTLGLTAYATFDLRNDAQLVRSRLMLSDIAVSLPVGHGSLCGQQRDLGFLYADCRLGVFLEAAEVLDAGRNADLLDNIDDEYVGLGGHAGVILSPQNPDWLRPLTFTLNYRIMHILSGRLDDPHRLEGALNYAIPLGPVAGGPGITFGIGRTLGANFETFQREDLWKVSLGFKF
jgi:hypothetical protein